MPLDLEQTIAALASPPGGGERGIIRLSGRNLADLLPRLFHADSDDWQNRRLPWRTEGILTIPRIGIPLSAALMYWPTSRSYTGQPMAEFHLTGATPLLDAVLERLFECGARPAERGEFTMRAFLSGRIDLVQAEAVVGVIDATNHEELTTALQQLGGAMTSRLATVRGSLIELLGDLEAGLDFVEEDIEFITKQEILSRLQHCQTTLEDLISDAHARLPSGYHPRIVLAGLPNAGKSTLFNCLLGQQKALVSPVSGTTRDYLSATIRLGEVDVEIIDTAGLEQSFDGIMQIAQEMRQEQWQASDLVLWCSAADNDAELAERDAGLRQTAVMDADSLIRVITRVDLLDTPTDTPDATADCSGTITPVSAVTGMGIASLRAVIHRRLAQRTSTRGELLASTAVRCRDSLRRAAEATNRALAATELQSGDELIAVEIRQILHELSVILGQVYTDDILDHIFSRFCIGK
ncbi:MAG: tRNA modification GTPase [Planctomycetaceae bacterium]|nr:tRNA modification GTPase [Planctomycetaceae bacterium]